MALSDPRALADFIEQAKVRSVLWRSQRVDKVSGAGSGQYVAVETSPPLWGADVVIRDLVYAKAVIVRAMINSLCRPGQSFYLYDPIAKYPASDPNGTILGASVVTLSSIGADNSSAAFTGLPPNYKLTRGDKFHAAYGTSPVRRAFFELSEDGAADDTGLTPTLAFYPALPTGIVATSVVNFAKPSAKVSIVPGSINLGTAEAQFVTGMGFTALQKI